MQTLKQFKNKFISHAINDIKFRKSRRGLALTPGPETCF